MVLNARIESVKLEEEAASVRSLATAVARELGQRSTDRFDIHFVPGRIEILGKHTDYAGGRSLTCAVAQGICLGAAARSDRDLVIADLTLPAEVRLDLSGGDWLEQPGLTKDWRRYPAVVARRLGSDFRRQLVGADIALASDLPPAAGLSSSSAFIVALFLGLGSANGLLADAGGAADSSRFELASYLAGVESGRNTQGGDSPSGVGTLGGSEDHTAILCSLPSRLRSYSYDPLVAEEVVSLPEDVRLAVAVSGVRAAKAGAAGADFNRLAAVAAAAAKVWRFESGSDHEHLAAAVRSAGVAAVRAAIERGRHDHYSPDELLVRFDHFVEESEVLVPEAITSLHQGDYARFGTIVERSQRLAEEKLRNQTPETMFLARSARESGALAASAFGAGFGGSVWAMFETGGSDDERAASRFIDRWRTAYTEAFPHHADAVFLLTSPSRAARKVRA